MKGISVYIPPEFGVATPLVLITGLMHLAALSTFDYASHIPIVFKMCTITYKKFLGCGHKQLRSWTLCDQSPSYTAADPCSRSETALLPMKPPQPGALCSSVVKPVIPTHGNCPSCMKATKG